MKFSNTLLSCGILSAVSSMALAVEKQHLPHEHEESLNIEHVLVSVPLHRQSSKTALPVAVISEQELQSQLASTLGATLERQPGVANASFGPGVGMPVIRGQQGRRVGLLINNIASTDVSSLSSDHAVAIEPAVAKRIEVLKGPSTLLYGGGAIGGVINVIDNRIPSNFEDTKIGAVEYRYESASDQKNIVFRQEMANDGWAVYLSGVLKDWNNVDIPGFAAHEEHEDEHDSEHEDAHADEEYQGNEPKKGEIENTSGENRNFVVGVSHQHEGGFFGFSASHLSNTYGIPLGGHIHHEEHEEEGHEHETEEEHEAHGDGITIDMEQVRFDARWFQEEPFSGGHELDWRWSYTDYQHDEIEGNGEVGTEFLNKSWQSRLAITHEVINGWHGTIGWQWQYDTVIADGEDSFIPKTRQRANGIFFVEGYDLGDWTFELGGRFDQVNINADTNKKQNFENFSYSFSSLWQLNDKVQLGAYLSHSERAPATEELYSNNRCDVTQEECVVHGATQSVEMGNNRLEEEAADSIDLSLRWQFAEHVVSAKAFYTQFKDYIYLQSSTLMQDDLPVYFYQQQDAEFKGVEIAADFSLMAQTDQKMTLKVFTDYVDASLDNGNDVPLLPPLRIGLDLDYRINQWQFSLSGLHALEQDKPGLNEENTEAYTRWNIDANRHWMFDNGQKLTAFAKVNNVSDEEIRLSTSRLREVAPEASRSIITGLRFSF